MSTIVLNKFENICTTKKVSRLLSTSAICDIIINHGGVILISRDNNRIGISDVFHLFYFPFSFYINASFQKLIQFMYITWTSKNKDQTSQSVVITFYLWKSCHQQKFHRLIPALSWWSSRTKHYYLAKSTEIGWVRGSINYSTIY